MLILLLSYAAMSTAYLKKARKVNTCDPCQGMRSSTAVSRNSSGLGMLPAYVSDTLSVDTCWGMHPEELPTVMVHGCLGFRISVLHLPGIMTIYSNPFTPPVLWMSGTLSNVSSEEQFGFTISVYFPWLSSDLLFAWLFSALLCWLLYLHAGSKCPQVVCLTWFPTISSCSEKGSLFHRVHCATVALVTCTSPKCLLESAVPSCISGQVKPVSAQK